MQEYRCPKCKKLLFKYDGHIDGQIVIKCRNCKKESAFGMKATNKTEGILNWEYSSFKV